MIKRASIEAVLDRLRPILWADGADVELLDIVENSATVRFTGLCRRCVSAPLTMQMGLTQALRDEIPEFGELRLEWPGTGICVTAPHREPLGPVS